MFPVVIVSRLRRRVRGGLAALLHHQVKRGQDEQGQDGGGNEPADDDDGKWPGSFRADSRDKAIGRKPNAAMNAVITMGRTREIAPSRTASRRIAAAP